MTATLPTQEQVNRIAKELAPDVVSIGFRVGRDWSDDPAIYFRVILSDEASHLDHLSETIKKVSGKLYEELDLAALDHFSYIHYRSQSEMAKLQDDPAWD